MNTGAFGVSVLEGKGFNGDDVVGVPPVPAVDRLPARNLPLPEAKDSLTEWPVPALWLPSPEEPVDPDVIETIEEPVAVRGGPKIRDEPEPEGFLCFPGIRTLGAISSSGLVGVTGL